MELVRDLKSADYYVNECSILSEALESMVNFYSMLADDEEIAIATEAATTEDGKSDEKTGATADTAKDTIKANGIRATIRKWLENFGNWLVKKFSKRVVAMPEAKVEEVADQAAKIITKLGSVASEEEADKLKVEFDTYIEGVEEKVAKVKEDKEKAKEVKPGKIKGFFAAAKKMANGTNRAEKKYIKASQHAISVATKTQAYITKHTKDAESDEEVAEVMNSRKAQKNAKKFSKAEDKRAKAEAKFDAKTQKNEEATAAKDAKKEDK